MHRLTFVIILLLLQVPGCAGLGGPGVRPQTYSRTFQAKFDEVWDATVRMFEGRRVGLKVVDKGRGKMVTDWLYRESEKQMGMVKRGYWRERHRLTLRFKDRGQVTEVTAYATVEEKRPGGTQAYRWERIPSHGDLEKEVLDTINGALTVMSKKRAG